MTTTTVSGIDVGALAGAIRLDVSERIAAMLEVAFGACDDRDGLELNQLQKIEFTSSALDQFDGFERYVAKEIIRALTEHGVEVWGLSQDLVDLQPGESDG